MSNKRILAAAAATVAFGVGAASAIEIDGMKGIGYAQAIGGPAGLAFNYGTGNLNIEAILGAQILMPKEGDGSTPLGLGIGAHFHALRSEHASMSVGGRLNIGMSKNPATVGKGGDQESITQFGIDIPVRVYWFPDKHVSLHAEMGISVVIEPEKGTALGASGAGAEGKAITIGGIPGGGGAFGNMGLTFWW